MPPFPPNVTAPNFPSSGPPPAGGPPGFGGPPPPGANPPGPPANPGGSGPSIHPDRLRMMTGGR